VDVCLVIKHRLQELGLEQKDLAAAAGVTESYISQVLTGKKLPPAPDRTDIYEKMTKFLKLPGDQLAKLAELQRQDDFKRNMGEPPSPLHREVRELIINKCSGETQKQVREIFEKQAFGELERLVTQKLLDVTKKIARDELENEDWLRSVAKLRSQSYEEARTIILEFLDTDVFNISVGHCASFLAPMIESWGIDLTTFAMKVRLNPLLSPVQMVNFQFVEREENGDAQDEPGFEEFLGLPDLSGDATEEELEFLQNLKFKRRRPTAMFYYRGLQNLRDPLHFRDGSALQLHKRRDVDSAERQKQFDSRKKAIRRWKNNSIKPNHKKES
jgi:transcriptional regulator with XRE-family HTH domain